MTKQLHCCIDCGWPTTRRPRPDATWSLTDFLTVPLPDDIPVISCDACGEYYVDDACEKAIEEALCKKHGVFKPSCATPEDERKKNEAWFDDLVERTKHLEPSGPLAVPGDLCALQNLVHTQEAELTTLRKAVRDLRDAEAGFGDDAVELAEWLRRQAEQQDKFFEAMRALFALVPKEGA